MPSQLHKSLNEILQNGMELLAMSMGIVSRIENNQYEVIAVVSKTGGV